jgi:hypothetical protein
VPDELIPDEPIPVEPMLVESIPVEPIPVEPAGARSPDRVPAPIAGLAPVPELTSVPGPAPIPGLKPASALALEPGATRPPPPAVDGRFAEPPEVATWFADGTLSVPAKPEPFAPEERAPPDWVRLADDAAGLRPPFGESESIPVCPRPEEDA